MILKSTFATYKFILMFKKIFFLFIVVGITYTVKAQEFFNGSNLSHIKAEQFNAEQIAQMGAELKANNMTMEQVEPLAMAKGMSAVEFNKLKARLESSNAVSEEVKKDIDPQAANTPEKLAEKNVSVFGSELFTTKSLSFEPNQNLPTPNNYILGPGDKLEISLYGVQQMGYSGTVNKNGTLSIPNVGEVFLSGMSFEAAKAKLKREIGKIYTTLGGGTKISTSISNYRTILVTIIGAQQSGNYSLSAMSTVYNALHVAGGPSEIGSYRKIELIRNNEVIKKVDIYDFLTKGDQSTNIALQDNDMIRIPSYDLRVVIEGEIKRPGVFELLPNEKMSQLIEYAQGFTENAYKNKILVKRKTNSQLKITDLNESNYSDFTLKAGDYVSIDKILNRFENRIQIKGAVFRPGEYSINENEELRISDLIAKADGVLENVFLKKGSLIRQNENLTREYISFSLEAVLNGNANENYILQKEDVVVIYTNQELLDGYSVSISGQVRSPGSYTFVKGMTLFDLLLDANYLTENASRNVTVFRRVTNDEYNPNEKEIIKSFDLDIDPKDPTIAEGFFLEPMDNIIVRRIVTYETPQMVTINGEVLYPGNYAILKKEETVLDYILRAGGLKAEANTDALRIKRNGLIIPIDWKQISKNPKLPQNITMLAGDVIELPTKQQTVTVTGNVMLPTEVPYIKGKSLRYYLENAGDEGERGWLKKAYVMYPNGSAGTTGSFLGFKNYPTIEPGSTIIIPTKPEKEGINSGEIIGYASILASLAGVIIAILR